jgi:hypothetical protein
MQEVAEGEKTQARDKSPAMTMPLEDEPEIIIFDLRVASRGLMLYSEHISAGKHTLVSSGEASMPAEIGSIQDSTYV